MTLTLTLTAGASANKVSSCAGPFVIGATMVDMHVETKIDDNFKVSYHFRHAPVAGKLSARRRRRRCSPKAATATAGQTSANAPLRPARRQKSRPTRPSSAWRRARGSRREHSACSRTGRVGVALKG